MPLKVAVNIHARCVEFKLFRCHFFLFRAIDLSACLVDVERKDGEEVCVKNTIAAKTKGCHWIVSL